MTATTLDADRCLCALLALGCTYRPHDLEALELSWIATCPKCRQPSTLHIREQRERDQDHPAPAVTVGCARRCTPPLELAQLLSTDPELLDARIEAARWRAFAHWTVNIACWALQR